MRLVITAIINSYCDTLVENGYLHTIVIFYNIYNFFFKKCNKLDEYIYR